MNNTTAKSSIAGKGARARLLAANLYLLLCGAGASAADYVYVVKPGDNPWNLTQRYLKSVDYWPRIQAYNHIDAPTHIPPGTLLRIPLAWMRAEATDARVLEVSGTAERESAGRTEPIVPGMGVGEGALIRSGDDSSLTLEFPDGSRSLVGANTEIRVHRLQRLRASDGQQTEIELRGGELENNVERANPGGRYIIRTPAAVAAVRGTGFRVAADARSMRTETLEGKVAMTNRRGGVLLPAGTGSYTTVGEKPRAASPLLPAPDLSSLPGIIDRVPFRLPIEPVAGATGYRTQIAASASFAALLSDRTAADAAVQGSAALPDGTYRMRTRAIGAHGLEGHDAEREIIIDARPEPPFPSQPAQDGFVTEAAVRFAWAHDPGARSYHFQLASDPGFVAIAAQSDQLTEPGIELGEALEPGDYYWRVAVSTNAEGRGPYSDTQRFRRPLPGPSTEPPEIDSDTLRLGWRAQQGVERYQAEISSTADFSAPEHRIETTDTALSIPRPQSGTWHVRVRSQEAGAPYGPWSKAQQIEVPYDYWRALWVLLPLLLAL